MESSGAVVDVLFNGLQDLGSNSRSPTYLLLFSFRYSSASHALQCTMVSHLITCQMAPGQIWWPRLNAYHEPKSTRVHGIPEGQYRPTLMGLEFADFTSNLGLNPPGLFLFLSFFLFYLFLFVFIIFNH